jgi:hypothetical protein
LVVKKTASYAYYALPVIGGLSLVMGMGVTLSKINLGVEEYLAQRDAVATVVDEVAKMKDRVGVLDDTVEMWTKENRALRSENKHLNKIIHNLLCRQSGKMDDC